MFGRLLHAEWFKLVRRPVVWLLLALFLLLMLFYFGLIFLLIAFHDGLFTGGETRIEILSPLLIDEYRRWITFPGVYGAVFSQVNSIGGICAIILAAAALGSEYGWGTLRLQLARQPRRGLYLGAKIAALLLVLLSGIAIALLVGTLLALLFSSLTSDFGRLSATHLLLLPFAALRALYVILPYAMVTIASCAFGRSVLAGAAGGLVFLTFDVSLGGFSLFLNENPAMQFLYNLLLLQQNINTLVVLNSSAFGLDAALLVQNLDLALLPHPLQATLVIAVYSALCFVAAYFWLARRDLGGAG